MQADPRTGPQTDPADVEEQQRQELIESMRQANSGQPRNFKEDALDEKVVTVEPDGTGPTSTGSFDTDEDKAAGSGSP